MARCPHCYVEVVPRSDGRCPACREDTARIAGTDVDKREFVVRQDEPLPDLCHNCGVPTKRRIEVKVEKYDENDHAPTGTAAVLLKLFGALAGLHVFFGRTKRPLVVDLRLPQCGDCAARHGSPEPRHVDFSMHAMTLVVHKAFRARVRREREERS